MSFAFKFKTMDIETTFYDHTETTLNDTPEKKAMSIDQICEICEKKLDDLQDRMKLQKRSIFEPDPYYDHVVRAYRNMCSSLSLHDNIITILKNFGLTEQSIELLKSSANSPRVNKILKHTHDIVITLSFDHYYQY